MLDSLITAMARESLFRKKRKIRRRMTAMTVRIIPGRAEGKREGRKQDKREGGNGDGGRERWRERA